MDFDIPDNLSTEEDFTVKDKHLAKHLGTGAVAVLSTPSMIGFMEHTTRRLVDSVLPNEYSTVGTEVSVKHLAAAPEGVIVRVKGKLISRNERKLLFDVEVWWNNIKLGEGTHERFIINQKRFIERIKEQTLKK